jgi:hypothetical protein
MWLIPTISFIFVIDYKVVYSAKSNPTVLFEEKIAVTMAVN